MMRAAEGTGNNDWINHAKTNGLRRKTNDIFIVSIASHLRIKEYKSHVVGISCFDSYNVDIV